MIEIPKSYTEFPDYKADMDYASTIDGNRDFYFVSRWFPVYLMGIKIRNLNVKDFMVLSAEKNDILTERFNFSDCVKLMYLLHYKTTDSLLLRSFREYMIGKKIIKYIQKTYPQDNIEERLNKIITEYWDNLLNDYPARNIPVDRDIKRAEIQCYSGYSFGSMLFLMMEKLHMSEKEIFELPIQVFFEYYQCLICSINDKYTRKGKRDYVDLLYLMRFDKVNKIMKENENVKGDL